ncbi:MAG TPA: hypothetical protein VKT78_05675 [Fimbriimonadaceae bacterium]|nr:hypothetical protein [Fimbriimonadaceae bacterium]
MRASPTVWSFLGATSAFVSLAACALATQSVPNADLVGTWKWVVPRPPDEKIPADRLFKQVLILRADGTFELHIENYVMYELIGNDSGTYKRDGDSVVLDGRGSEVLEDGTSRQHHDHPFRLVLKLVGGALVARMNDGLEGETFRRQSTDVPAILAKPAAPAFDPKALAVIREVQRVYASVKSFSGSGTTMTREVRTDFQLVYQGPDKLFVSISEGSFDQRHGNASCMWINGKHAWASRAKIGATPKAAQPLPIKAAMRLADPSGRTTAFIPPLLMPKMLGPSSFFTGIRAASVDLDEKVRGRPCFGLLMIRKNGALLRVWIDKALYVVLESDDETADISTVFHGQLDPKLSPQDRWFSPPKTH